MTRPIDVHCPIEEFNIQDNCLSIGGRSIIEIAEQVGDRPYYVYDRSLIERRIEKLRQSLPDRVELHYAIKANPMPDVVHHIAPLVDGLDVASLAELKCAVSTSCNSDDISFAGPGKSLEELRESIASGVSINVESITELERIISLAKSSATRPRVAFRVNPDFELKSSGMKMSGGPKQFGIDAEQLPDILRGTDFEAVDFIGFHIFSGSQNLNVDAICDSQQKACELAVQLSKYAPVIPKVVNIGGGFGIPYFKADRPITLKPISTNLESLLGRMDKELPGARIVLELGRYIVGESGVYICRVIDKKVSRGQTFLITNGGLHHHLAATGNFGQIIRKDYPIAIANKIHSDTKEPVSVVGPLCTPLDILADKMHLPTAEIGDYVAVFQSGAYGYTASPHGFLSHPPPAQLFV